MSNPETTECSRCSQRLRIASERVPKVGQTLGLVCPRCGERWRWSPAGRAAMRELAFRCAHSGGRFAVLYAKESRDTKFRVRAIEEDAPVIKRLLSAATAARAARIHTAGRIADGAWAAIEFDHSGWRCPYCRSRGVTTNSFVKCGTCNGLVCGASMVQVQGGVRTFRCPCGAHAEVSDGAIASFDGKMTDVVFHPRAGGARELPAQQGGSMPELGRGAAAPGAKRFLSNLLPRAFSRR